MGYGKGTKGGRPIGTSKYPYRDDQDRELIVSMIKRGTTNEDIAARTGWSPVEVRDIRATFFPTASLAADYLRANALKLARRVVEEANVEEAVDILSRPNIGVLEPAQKQAPGARIGIITNINTSTLGGVMETQVFDLDPPSGAVCSASPPEHPPPSPASRSLAPAPASPAHPSTPAPPLPRRKKPSATWPMPKP